MITTVEVIDMLKNRITELEGAIHMTELLLTREAAPFKGDKLLALQLQRFIKQRSRMLNRIEVYRSFGK